MASVSAATRRLEERLDRIEQLLECLLEKAGIKVLELPRKNIAIIEEGPKEITGLLEQFKGN